MANQAASVATPALLGPPSLVGTVSKDGATSSISSNSQFAPKKMEYYFTKSQMALALTIQRSKPEGVPTREYCLQLQRRITQNKPENQTKFNRYVDTCEFWKDQYTRIHQEKKDLEEKVRMMEEKEHTHHRSRSPGASLQLGMNHSRKRPVALEEVEGWLDEQKLDLALPPQDNIQRLSSYILRITRQRSDLERITGESDRADHIDNLARTAGRLLGLLESALSDCCTPLWSLRCDDQQQTVLLFQQLTRQIGRGFRSCFEAMNELARTIPGRKKRFGILYRLVVFFRESLNHLHIVSNLQAQHVVEDNGGLRSKRARADRDGAEYAVNKYVSEALVSISQIEWKIGQPGHREILEGILYSVLTHTGRLLSNTVFNEHVAMSNRAGNITAEEAAGSTENFEFRYIVPILHATLGDCNARKQLVARVLTDSVANSYLPSRPGSSAASSNGAGDLLFKAKKLMQETLVKSAVGSTELQSLRPPTAPKDQISHSPDSGHHTVEFGQQWFLESVWGLVGWELAV